MLPQAPLSPPIMLCCSRKSDGCVVHCHVRFSCPHWRISYYHNLILYFISFWSESEKVFLAECVMIILLYITPTWLFFPAICIMREVNWCYVNWSVCNPHYKIRMQLMVYLKGKHIDPFMFWSHGKTTAADNQWWSIYKPTINSRCSSVQWSRYTVNNIETIVMVTV